MVWWGCVPCYRLRVQVPIFSIMRKFDGETVVDDIRQGRRRFRITRLPRFLLLHMKRFTKVRHC